MFVLTSDGIYNIIYEGEMIKRYPVTDGFIDVKSYHISSTILFKNDGVYVCGNNYNGKLCLNHRDDVTIPQRIPIDNITNICITDRFSIIVTNSGLYLREGYNIELRLTSIKNVLSVNYNDNNSIILTTDGAYGIGDNKCGVLGIGNYYAIKYFQKIQITENIKSVAMGYNCTYFVTDEGNIYFSGIYSHNNQKCCPQKLEETAENVFIDIDVVLFENLDYSYIRINNIFGIYSTYKIKLSKIISLHKWSRNNDYDRSVIIHTVDGVIDITSFNPYKVIDCPIQNVVKIIKDSYFNLLVYFTMDEIYVRYEKYMSDITNDDLIYPGQNIEITEKNPDYEYDIHGMNPCAEVYLDGLLDKVNVLKKIPFEHNVLFPELTRFSRTKSSQK